MSSNKFNLSDFSVKKLDAQTDLSGFECNNNDELGLDEMASDEKAAPFSDSK